MDEILKLRFEARDKNFMTALTGVQQSMAARGLLGSGETVKQGYKALEAEYVGSRETIASAIGEQLRIDRPNKIDPTLQTKAKEILHSRKEFLESYYKQHTKAVLSHLKNEKMFEEYATLNEVLELHDAELERSLSEEFARYLDSRGATLLERVKNQFFDRPLVVIAVITISAVVAILAFLELFGINE